MRRTTAILASAALAAGGGCDGVPAPEQRTWPRLVAEESAPEERALVRVDDSALVGMWEGESPGEGWPAPTLTIEQPNLVFCGNSFMGSVDGVFYDEQGRAVDITPTRLIVTHRRKTGDERLPDGTMRAAWDIWRYDAYVVELDGERYLGLSPIYRTPDGVGGYSPHRWHKLAIRENSIEITWSGAVVHWLADMQALEDSSAEVVGEPGSEVEPKFGSYVTGSLQRFLEFHQRIADREEFWEDRTVWRRVAPVAGQAPPRASERPQPREADGVEAK